MDRLAILFCAMAPAVVLLLYGIAKAHDRWDDAAAWQTFFVGGVSAVFVLLPELLLNDALAADRMAPLHGAAAEALLIAAIPEETMKFLAVVYAVRRLGDGLPLQDIITLSLAAALGFAAIENLCYLVAPGSWQLLALSRAITAVPSHGLDGLAMGALLSAARLHRAGRHIWMAAALALPVLLHAGYDFPLCLVARDRALYGVLPAWLVMSILATIGILYLSNKVRAAASLRDRRAGRLDARPPPSFTSQQAGAAILLAAPLLAMMKLLIDGQLGIVDAGAIGLMPIILGIDLLCTGRAQAARQ